VELFPKGASPAPGNLCYSRKLLGLVMLINYAVRFRQTFTSQPPAVVRVIHRLINRSDYLDEELNLGPSMPGTPLNGVTNFFLTTPF
jgi:hypothetical protein